MKNLKKKQKYDVVKTACKKKNILITPIAANDGHIFEGIFSQIVRYNNDNVYTLFCGHTLKKCDCINYFSNYKNLRCSLCCKEQDEFLNAFPTNEIFINDYITKKDYLLIEQISFDFFENKNYSQKLFNVKLDKLLYSALQRYYLIAEPHIKNDKVCYEFLHTILVMLITMKKICDQISPELVVTSHGIYSTWGAITEFCRENNIRLVTWGRIYNDNGILFAYNDSYINKYLYEGTETIENIELNDKVKNKVDEFYQSRLGILRKSIPYDYNKNNKQIFTKKEICELLSIPNDSKIISLFPNIPWDGEVTGNGEFKIFSGFKEWLKVTLKYFEKFADPKSYLVIRAHPAEIGGEIGTENIKTLLEEIYQDLPTNIIYLGPKDKINSFCLAKNSIYGIVYSSTVALESIYLKTPIIIGGNPSYKNKGIMYTPKNKQEYINLITQGLNKKLKVTEENIKNLYKYTYYYFFIKSMPEQINDYSNSSNYFRKNMIETLSENKLLSYMYKTLINEKNIDFSEYY